MFCRGMHNGGTTLLISLTEKSALLLIDAKNNVVGKDQEIANNDGEILDAIQDQIQNASATLPTDDKTLMTLQVSLRPTEVDSLLARDKNFEDHLLTILGEQAENTHASIKKHLANLSEPSSRSSRAPRKK